MRPDGREGGELADEERAPDARIRLSDGSTGRLSEFWEQGPVALVFLRHFG